MRDREGRVQGELAIEVRSLKLRWKPPPARHWRSYGYNQYRRVGRTVRRLSVGECAVCGKVVMINESHAAAHYHLRDRPLSEILARMRHEGCGGLAGEAERVQPPERKIVLLGS